MDDSIIILSSDDETTPGKVPKAETSKSNGFEIKSEPSSSHSKKEKVHPTGETKRKGDDSTQAETSSSLPKKQKPNCNEDESDSNISISTGLVSGEQDGSESSVLTEFISTCLTLDSTSSMKKILENKLKKYYSLLIPEYKTSEQFYMLLERKQAEMLRCPSHLFRHLKEFLDELYTHREDKIKKQPKGNTSDHFIRKLCKAMELLHRKIKKLEEKELDWDDDNDSVYLQLQRYRERFIKVHNKLQELEGEVKPIFKRKISFSGTQFPSINRAIEKYVNTKGEFPDYHDIFNLLKESYASEGIKVLPAQLKSEAKSVFQNVGEQLQKQRQYECWESHSSFLETDVDPAEENLLLHSTLEENKKKYGSRIDEVINSFAEKRIKNQFVSDDSNSSGMHQNEGISEQENVNGNAEEGKEKEGEGDIDQVENQEEEELTNVDSGDEPDDGDNDNNEEDSDEEEDEDDDEDGDEDSANKIETMEDILNDLNKDHNVEYTEQLFLYHGPVSPPKEAYDDKFNIDSVSPLPSPGFDISWSTEKEVPGEAVEIHDEPSNKCVANEETDKEPIASCSTWNVLDSIDSNGENLSESPEQTCKDSQPFLKVKSLSSLMRQADIAKEPVEILLD